MTKKYSYIFLILILLIGPLYPKVSLIAIICMLAPIITSFFKGRYYCSNICPRGSFYDQQISKISKRKVTPKILRSKLFRLLILVVMFGLFGIGIKNNWGDITGISLVFYKMVLATTSIGIFLSLFFNHRTWCSFCPMGSISDFIVYLKRK